MPDCKGKMIVLHTNGDKTETPINKFPTLSKLQKAVGGFIEQIPLFDTYLEDGERVPCLALCNEEGKLHNLRDNRAANEAWLEALSENGNMPKFTDMLVGPVVILTGAEIIAHE